MRRNLFDNAGSLEEAVYQAVGAASMAWESTPAGVFDEQFANVVATDLLATIARFSRGVNNAE